MWSGLNVELMRCPAWTCCMCRRLFILSFSNGESLARRLMCCQHWSCELHRLHIQVMPVMAMSNVHHTGLYQHHPMYFVHPSSSLYSLSEYFWLWFNQNGYYCSVVIYAFFFWCGLKFNLKALRFPSWCKQWRAYCLQRFKGTIHP